jgi:hypothetical protein
MFLRQFHNDTVAYLSTHMDVEGISHDTIASLGASVLHQANPGKPVISSECCSCQVQRGEDYMNTKLGISYPHALSQAQCLQKCMNYSYPTATNSGEHHMHEWSCICYTHVWYTFVSVCFGFRFV